MEGQVFELFKVSPFGALVIGVLCAIVAVLIYRLLKKDIANLEKGGAREMAALEARLSKETALLKTEIALLNKETAHLNKETAHLKAETALLNKETAHLKTETAHLKTEIALLNKETADLKDFLILKISSIEKQLNNHVTETDKKIERLSKDVAELKDGQARLERKLDKILGQKPS